MEGVQRALSDAKRRFYEGAEKRGVVACVWSRLQEHLARYRAAIGVREEAVMLQREWLGKLRGKRVLEIGAGAGNVLSMEVACASGEYLGVDLSETSIRALREKIERAGLGHARAEAWDFMADDWPYGEFDVIYSSSVLHAFPDRDPLARVLARRLRPVGVLVAWEPLNMGLLSHLVRAAYRPFQPDRAWHSPLDAGFFRTFEKHFAAEHARGLLGCAKWGFPLGLMPGMEGMAVRLGRRLAVWDRRRKSLRGFHQAVLVWRKRAAAMEQDRVD